VIVVIGSPVAHREAGTVRAGGLAARVALAAASAGRTVQLVGRIGDDADADPLLQALARGGVGHVAMLRDASRPTIPAGAAATDAGPHELEAADVELALRYLVDFAVVVVVEPTSTAVLAVVADAADWGEATVVLVRSGDLTPTGPVEAVVLETEIDEAPEAFGERVGSIVAALDAGVGRGPAPSRRNVRSAG